MENNKITIIQVAQDKNGNFLEDGIRELEIKPMRYGQFLNLTAKLKVLIDEMNKDENISGALSGIFDGVEEGMGLQDVLVNASASFYKDAVGSLGLIFELFPEKVGEILALLANMSYEELQFQEVDVFFDILDRVVEVNDFQKVIDRVKLSFGLLGKQMGWRQVVQEATAPKVIK
ncbi:hypothetical protein [Macrococcus animalis]|uniref:hypothetical protein n=1 Tax=Macrococcus animalis TaxID=3395467 RepID=UPI0039BEB09A